MSVRLAEPSDLPALAPIEAAADQMFTDYFARDLGWPPPHPGEERAAEPGYLLVAEATPEIVGFAHVLEIDGHAHLEQLAVHPDHLRAGIGRALVDAARSEAAERGYDLITLTTYADVPWNAPFYATLGFAEVPPTGPFHRRLVEVEHGMGLDRPGRRVLMSSPTATHRNPSDT